MDIRGRTRLKVAAHDTSRAHESRSEQRNTTQIDTNVPLRKDLCAFSVKFSAKGDNIKK